MVLKMTFFNFWCRGTVSEISAKNLLKMRGWVKITPLEIFFSKGARWKISIPHSSESSHQDDFRKVSHSLGSLNSTWVPFSRMVTSKWNWVILKVKPFRFPELNSPISLSCWQKPYKKVIDRTMWGHGQLNDRPTFPRAWIVFGWKRSTLFV